MGSNNFHKLVYHTINIRTFVTRVLGTWDSLVHIFILRIINGGKSWVYSYDPDLDLTAATKSMLVFSAAPFCGI